MAKQILLSDTERARRLKESIKQMEERGNFNRKIITSYKKQLREVELILKRDKDKREAFKEKERK